MPSIRVAAPLLLSLCTLVATGAAGAPRVVVGTASADGILSWEPERFVGETRYLLEPDAGRPSVRAESRASASGLVREIDVDLRETPVLHWSWRVANLLEGVDERSKGGDDYPARVYILFRTGWLDVVPRSLSYVWSSTQPRGTAWPNAYTDRVVMLAQRDASDPVGTWIDERRDVREDIRRHFGADVDEIKAVAIMTDTDNSASQATAWYGDIWFAAE